MSKLPLTLALLILLAALTLPAFAAPKGPVRATVNAYEQLEPFRAHYATRTDWPRAHGYKAFKRYEWDVLQRGWPDGNIPAGAYWEALQQRNRMGHHTLDEPWTNLGPYNHGGRARVLRWDPRNLNIMYAGAVSGGIFKSTDAGESWFPLTDPLPNLSVGCFELDPSHPDTMYLGTGEGYYNGDAVMGIGLLKSTDSGQSWNLTGLSYNYNQGQSILKVNIDPRNGQIVLASTNSGLYRSTDGAQTFGLVQSGDVKDLVRDPENPDVLLCAPGNPGGSGSNGIYRSENNGVSFTRITSGLPPTGNIGRIVLAFYRGNSQVIYAGISGTWNFNGSQMIGLFRSVDNGLTWMQMSADGVNHYASQAWYDMALAVKPDLSSTVLSAGLDTWRTTNSGAVWSQRSHWEYEFGNPQYVHADHHQIVFHPTNFDEVWQVTDGGVFKSTNLGNTWTEKNNGFVTFQYYAMGNATLDTALAYGGTQDNGSFRYHGSPSFNSVFGGDGGYCVVDYTDDNTVYVEWQNGHRSRSDDGGNNFSDINPGIDGDGAWVCPMALDPFDHLTVYTTTTSGRVYRSPNQGRDGNWQTLGQQLSGNMQVIAPSPVVQGRLYLATENTVYRYETAGGQWVNVTGNLPNAWVTRVAPDPVQPDVVYVTLSGFGHGHVYKSSQAGGNWSNISGNLPDVPYQDVIVDLRDHTTLYAGGDIGVYYSADNGQNWQIFGDGMPAARVDDMDMQPVTGVLRAATHGRGMWEVPTGSSNVALLYPNGGEALHAGTAINLRWAGTTFGGNVTLDINRSYPSAAWETLFASTPNDGAESWTVTAPASDHVRFRISHLTQPGQTDSSNSDSRIIVPSLRMVWPNGGETVFTGVRDTIRFARHFVTDPLKLELNRTYPSGAWEELATNIGSDSSTFWIVRLPSGSNARLRVSSVTTPSLFDESDADFTLRAPVISLETPSGGEQIPIGQIYTVRWSAPEHHSGFVVKVNRDYPNGTWEQITANTQNSGVYNWTPTAPASDHCRLRLITLFDAQSFAESAADFSLVAVNAGETRLPTEFKLHEPYPNPFNPTTVVTIELPARTKVTATVFNQVGQQVATLHDGLLDAGKHDLRFDASNEPSGLYYIHVEAAGQTQILKAALVK